MTLKVTAIDDKFIHCGGWKFDRTLGYEVDEDCGWGIPDADNVVHSGTTIRPCQPKTEPANN